MKVTIFGTGYVGLVSGSCLAQTGNHVVCVDVDEGKIAALNDGKIPIFEPGLEELVHENVAAERLQFTTDVARAVAHGEYLFIAVGTPPGEDGSADLKHVLEVAESIGTTMRSRKLIVNKSTVPVGTAEKVAATVSAALERRGVEIEFTVVSNPEFLKEGAAIEDCMKPDRIVIGSDDPEALARIKELYAPFNRNHEKVIAMDVRSAELTKYAANAMLATKISFMNEMANLAERLGADIEAVRIGIGSDPRIGFAFIYPGCGYGGSCFPKDVQALNRAAQECGYEPRLLQAVETVNRDQKQLLAGKIAHHFGTDLRGRRFALWGLSFKPNTDDMREAPSVALIEALLAAGATVAAYDPQARAEAQRVFSDRAGLELVDKQYAALEGADALVVVTEWKSFWSPDFGRIAAQLKQPVIFDGRNIYDPERLAAIGFTYYGIGRGTSTHGDSTLGAIPVRARAS